MQLSFGSLHLLAQKSLATLQYAAQQLRSITQNCFPSHSQLRSEGKKSCLKPFQSTFNNDNSGLLKSGPTAVNQYFTAQVTNGKGLICTGKKYF